MKMKDKQTNLYPPAKTLHNELGKDVSGKQLKKQNNNFDSDWKRLGWSLFPFTPIKTESRNAVWQNHSLRLHQKNIMLVVEPSVLSEQKKSSMPA